MTSALQRRVDALEHASSGGKGCDRCRGTLVIVENATSGALERVRWNGEDITEAELQERQAERGCPRCGRRIEPTKATEIRVGGQRRLQRG